MAIEGRTTLTYRDRQGEESAVGIRHDELTAANYDATVLSLVGLQDAIAAMTVGIKGKVVYANSNAITAAKPTEPWAQRESKWLVRFHDTAGNRGTLELPCADLTLLGTDSEQLPIDGTEAAAFVSALEGLHKNKYGNAITVDSITYVSKST